MSNPLVSVIMPVYNGERYLSEAVESILNQTYENFQFIILDDGSIDDTPHILSAFELKDQRIQIHSSKKNRGIIHVLNQGIKLAKGKYIARMDADDISLPDRLEKQVAFLEKHPSYALVGSKTELIFSSREPSGIYPQLYTTTDELRISSLFHSPFSHPSIMMKTSIAKEFRYALDYHKIEDYELWIRILKHYPCHNLKERLLYYRMHPAQETQIKKDIQINNLKRLYKEQFDLYHISFTEAELTAHLLISGSNNIPLNFSDLDKINLWLVKLHQQLSNMERFNNKYLNDIFGDVWKDVCWKTKHRGWGAYHALKKGHFYKKTPFVLSIIYFFSHSFFSPLHYFYLKMKRGY